MSGEQQPVEDDLSDVVRSLNQPVHARQKPIDPNDPVVRTLLEAGVIVLYEDLISAGSRRRAGGGEGPDGADGDDVLDSRILAAASGTHVVEVAHERFGITGRTRQVRVSRWQTDAQFGADLARYIFRPNRGVRRIVELRSQFMPAVIGGGASFGEFVHLLAGHESDEILDDPTLVVHGALCALMPQHSVTRTLARAYQDRNAATWGETYTLMGTQYDFAPTVHTWHELAVLFNALGDGLFLQGGYSEGTPQVQGRNAMEVGVQLMLAAAFDRTWPELAGIRPLPEDVRPPVDWTLTASAGDDGVPRPVDDDLTDVVRSLNQPVHARQKPIDPNDPVVRTLLEAGVLVLHDDLIAAVGRTDQGDDLDHRILAAASGARVVEVAHERFGITGRTRQVRVSRWQTDAQFGGDLVRYIFRPARGVRRIVDLRSQHLPGLLDAGVPFGDIVGAIAAHESDTVIADPIMAVHSALSAAMSKNSVTARLAREYHRITLAVWGETYAHIGAAYGITLRELTWDELAVLFNALAEGVGIQGGYRGAAPEVGGRNLLEVGVQAMLVGATGRPWDELAALTPLPPGQRPDVDWTTTNRA